MNDQQPQRGNHQPNGQWQGQWHGQQPPAYGAANHLPPTPPYVQPAKPKNWFSRHKILTGLAAFLLVAAIGSAAANGGNGGSSDAAADSSSSFTTGAGGNATEPTSKELTKKESTKKETTQNEPAKPAKKEPGVGSPVRDGKFEFTVTKVKTGVKSVGDQYLSKQAQGSFVLISVTVKNIGDKAQTMFDDNQKLRDADGREFSADTEAAIHLKNNDLWLKEVNPGNTATGTLIYDMPAGATPASLELHDSAFSGGVTVSLR